MARPLKQGMDYFPCDIDLDQDDKLGMIIGEFQFKGELLFTKLLGWIYKHEGYFCDWGEDVQLRFLRRYSYCGFSVSFLNEVVPRFIKWGLFDQSVFDAFQILTSSRIQETWLDATRKRKERYYIPDYWLIGVNDALKAEETNKKAEETNKRKEIKGNESKRNLLAPPAPAINNSSSTEILQKDPERKRNAGPRRSPFIKPTLEEINTYFLDRIGDPADPRSWPPDKIKTQSSKFFNHYEANGWVQGRQGKPIVDWKSSVRNWIQNELEHAFSPSPTVQPEPKKEPVKRVPTKTLSVIEQDINYLYETYLEGKCGIMQVDVKYYDHLKQNNLISFLDNEIEDIKARAHANLKEMKIVNGDTSALLKAMMKKEGVLEFFKIRMKASGSRHIFNLEEVSV